MNVKTFSVALLLSLAASTQSAVHAAPTVTQAELFAGNPEYAEPMDRAKEGQGLRDDPPVQWRTMLFIGDKLVTTAVQEIWYTDLSAAKPVVKRLAGQENHAGRSLRGGPGRQARFCNIFGLAVLPDGSLVGADQTANCVFVIKDPLGPGCNVSLIAGTTTPQDTVDPGDPPNVGDVDGPGARAKFGLPQWPAVVGDNIYVIDETASKLKQIGSDAAHTVKTIAKLPEGMYYAMISLNGKLYTLANNTVSEGFILEIDPATGAIREVVRGHADTFQGNGAINVSGLATDGKGLFTSQSGQLLYVTLDGDVKAIAGTGDTIEFSQPYDFTKPQKADKVQLVSMRRVQTAGSNVFLGYHDGAVYYSATSATPYVEKLTLK